MSKDKPDDFDAANRIQLFMHCRRCLEEIKAHAPGTAGQSPETYARLSVGWTRAGFQAWCVRHDINVLHVWFEGQQHPAITYRLPDPIERH